MYSQTRKFDLTFLVLGVLILQVILSAGLFFRIDQVYRLVVASGSVTNTSTTDTTFVSGVSPDDDPSLGPATAPVTIVEFSDFQCPFCARSAPVLKELLSKYPDQVRLVYRDFPIETIHSNAIDAALAAECADEQGAFWNMHDALFADQDALDIASLEEHARQIGLDMPKFTECLSTQRYLDEVRQDMADGRSYGVGGTPTFFINGYRLVGAHDLSVFEQQIEQALSNK